MTDRNERDALVALYKTASKGFHVMETSGLDKKYQHISRFRSMDDLHAFEEAWVSAMVGCREALAAPAEGDGGVAWIDVFDHKFGRRYETSMRAMDMPKGRYYTRPAATAQVPNIGVGVDVSSDGIDVTVVLRDGSVDEIIHHEHHELPTAPATAQVPDDDMRGKAMASLETLVAACEGAFTSPDTDRMEDADDDISIPPTGITFGNIWLARDALRILTAAPAAPKGGVMDEAMARIGELIRTQDNRSVAAGQPEARAPSLFR